MREHYWKFLKPGEIIEGVVFRYIKRDKLRFIFEDINNPTKNTKDFTPLLAKKDRRKKLIKCLEVSF